MSRITNWLLVLALLVAPNAQAAQTIIPGVLGYTNQITIFAPNLNANGVPSGMFSAGNRNTSLLYVNCRTQMAVARVCASGIPNLSGRSAVFRNNAQVATCLGEDITDFINQVCNTNFSPGQVANAVTFSLAVYTRPVANKSFVCITGVGSL